MDPLLSRLLERPGPMLVLAHPGSGTQFLVDRIRERGMSAAHERIGGTGVLAGATVSWRYWPWQMSFPKFAGRVVLIRDPLRTVYSAGALFGKRPDVRCDVEEELGSGVGRADPYVAALHTVCTWYARIEALDWEVFPLERFAVPDGARLNSHAKLEASWPNLAGRCFLREDRIAYEILADVARRHGYDAPVREVA